MSWFVGNIIRDFIKRIAIDFDEAIVASDIKEYYFDHGALFNFATEAESVENNAMIQFELVPNGSELRLFEYKVSTLSDDYQVCIHEVEQRDYGLFEEVVDYTEEVMLKPNRINLKEYPGEVYRLTQGGSAEYADLEAAGEMVLKRRFILEEGGGPQAADLGGVSKEATAIRFNQDKSYILCIQNFDSTTQDFFLSCKLGVPELIEVS